MKREARWPNAKRWHRVSGMDWIWRPTRLAIYARDRERCFACGDRRELTLDHAHDFGGNTPANLLTMCNTCNATRGEKPLEEFLGRARYLAALEQLRKPIDRALGRERCDERWPGFLESNRARARARSKAKFARKRAA